MVEVPQRVVHPAHVPLQAEAQPAQIGGPRHAGPGRRFLGHGEDARILQVDLLVELLDEGDRFQVFAPAELIGNPLAVLAAVVEVEHRGDRIDPQPIDVILVEPEQGIGHQEIAHFVASIVEDQGSPVGMLSLPRVGMLVQVRAVEIRKPVGVLGEVGRHPVDQHANAMLVAMIDKVHEVFRAAVATGRREIADRLISPTARERMLAHGHQLQVRVAELLAVVDQVGGPVRDR